MVGTGDANSLGGDRPANAETVITSLEKATFDNSTGVAEFIGSVTVKDPQFTLTSDRLKAFLNSDRKGLERVEATGNVVIRQENKNERGEAVVSVARAGKAIFHPDTGDVDLTEWPQVTQGINAHVATEATTRMVLNRAGKINTAGSSRTMIVDTGENTR
jgi:lipopolysaccharide transport protein LptA